MLKVSICVCRGVYMHVCTFRMIQRYPSTNVAFCECKASANIAWKKCPLKVGTRLRESASVVFDSSSACLAAQYEVETCDLAATTAASQSPAVHRRRQYRSSRAGNILVCRQYREASAIWPRRHHQPRFLGSRRRYYHYPIA